MKDKGVDLSVLDDIGMQEYTEDYMIWLVKNQDPHLDLAQMRRGWILTIILLRQWNWRK
jgi:hypothetical protein